MKIIIITFAIIIMTAASGSSQNKITIKVITSRMDASSSVYISGSNSNLGDWNPSAVKLDKVNDTTWQKTFYFNTGETVGFKFTKGTWDTEALTYNGNVPDNNTLIVTEDSTIVYSISKWKDKTNISTQNSFEGRVTGTVKYKYRMEGNGIKPRDIIVWLPPSYNSETSKRYPVLYMHDGQNLFDPRTASFGVDWQLDEATDSLINSGAIPDIIIVGIYNTTDRTKEYGDTPLGRKYMDFIVNTLKPYIDINFRTLTDRINTATGGSSMGGLISFMLVWEHPDIFSKAACLSPAFHIDEINYIKKVEGYSGIKKPLKIYIDIGTVELESRLKPGVDEMIAELKNKGYQPGTDLEYFIDDGATHSEAAWAKRNWRFLEFLFNK